jgi:hypothetical protein
MADKTSEDGHDDSTGDPLAAGCADRGSAGPDAQVSVPGTTRISRRLPPVDPAAAPKVAGAAAALASAIAIQRRNEARRPRLQRWVGALPHRRVREDFTVRTGALVAGTFAHVLVAGAMTGLQRYQDRKARIADARMICQIVGVAARAPDGSIPADSRIVLESALKGTGLGDTTRNRLLAEPLPMAIGDLAPVPLRGDLLEVIPMIAFSAMAEATNPDEAADRIPSLLRRIGLPRPTAEAMAERLIEEYNSKHMILSDYYARLTSPAPDRSIPLHLPVSEITAVTESVIARNPNELARQDTRQTFAALILRGVRATLVSGVRLNPRTLTAVRMIAQFFGEEIPALPEPIASPAPRRQVHRIRADTCRVSGEAGDTSTYLHIAMAVGHASPVREYARVVPGHDARPGRDRPEPGCRSA